MNHIVFSKLTVVLRGSPPALTQFLAPVRVAARSTRPPSPLARVCIMHGCDVLAAGCLCVGVNGRVMLRAI